MIEEQSSSSINYLIVINVYDFFTLKKTLKRPFKAILKSFKLLLIFYRIHFIFSFFTLHTLQPRTRKSYPHFHKPFKFAILRGCSSLFTYTVFLILLFLLHISSFLYNTAQVIKASYISSTKSPKSCLSSAYVRLSSINPCLALE